MVFITEKPVKSSEVPEHDLPLLAARQNPVVTIDWEPLIDAGVQPALPLGAERRWQGRR